MDAFNCLFRTKERVWVGMDREKVDKVEIAAKTGDPLTSSAEGLVFGVWDDGRMAQDFRKRLDGALQGEVSRILDNGEFKGSSNDVLFLPTMGKLSARYIVLAGLGSREKTSPELIRKVSGTVARAARSRNLASLASTLVSNDVAEPEHVSEAIVEGTFLALYRFDHYKSTDNKDKKEKNKKAAAVSKDFASLHLFSSREAEKKVRKGIDWARAILRGTYLARDLGNHPANVATPSMIAQTASVECQKRGIHFVSYDREKLEEMGLGALVGVAKGSMEPARLIQLEYRPSKAANAKPVLLVGKTLTFDSGGISLKPAEKMETMKGDMSGGAAVLGTMMAIADLGIPLWVVGLMPATENMPSGTANKPGDVLRAFNGKTIEVINTDAEGRLILADALSWGVKKFDPALVIDLATLTGAVTVALGAHAIGVLGNDQKRLSEVLEIGERVGEKGWQLPLFEEYFEQIKSPIADIQNVGGRGAGTITAAAFLSHFVDEKPWVHLDIAGTAWVESDEPYKPKGNVGIGIRLLTHYLGKLSEDKDLRKPEKRESRKK
ncbi:leucyl aminopeptidase [Leptospirillum ferriphilum]|uniref:leucyl aminopeptidase n=1 Tax=Leptospirillum ferriphilum TaxID=178606 RepID=UPI002117AA28|nr:leucyl aminopeptidase [Leptospirillum ferriphilum]